MFDPREKICVFIDGANLYATSKNLGFDIDYRRLLKYFRGCGYVLRAYYYTALVEDQEYSSIRPLIDWLDYNGYRVVTKPAKEYTDSGGRRRIRGNMDIESRCHGAGGDSRPPRFVFRRWRAQLPGGRAPETRQESVGRFHGHHPAGHDRRLPAAPS